MGVHLIVGHSERRPCSMELPQRLGGDARSGQAPWRHRRHTADKSYSLFEAVVEEDECKWTSC